MRTFYGSHALSLSLSLSLSPPPPPHIEALSSIVSGGLRPELVDIWSQRCAFVVDEILQTEGDYVNALDDIIQVLQKFSVFKWNLSIVDILGIA